MEYACLIQGVDNNIAYLVLFVATSRYVTSDNFLQKPGICIHDRRAKIVGGAKLHKYTNL